MQANKVKKMFLKKTEKRSGDTELIIVERISKHCNKGKCRRCRKHTPAQFLTGLGMIFKSPASFLYQVFREGTVCFPGRFRLRQAGWGLVMLALCLTDAALCLRAPLLFAQKSGTRLFAHGITPPFSKQTLE